MSDPIITVTIEPDMEQLGQRFAQAQKGLGEALALSLHRLGARFIQVARATAPGKTGGYRQSLAYTVTPLAGGARLTVTSKRPLGTFIVTGTRPHIIRAKNARVLSFYWEKGPRGAGRYAFVSVHHPGTKPHSWREQALKQWLPEARRDLTETARRYGEMLPR